MKDRAINNGTSVSVVRKSTVNIFGILTVPHDLEILTIHDVQFDPLVGMVLERNGTFEKMMKKGRKMFDINAKHFNNIKGIIQLCVKILLLF